MGVQSDWTEVDIDGESWANPPSMGCDEYSNQTHGELSMDLDAPRKVMQEFSITIKGRVIGAASKTVISFGDGESVTNCLWPSHTWHSAGIHQIVLTSFNNDYPLGLSVTQAIDVVSISEAIHVSLSGNDIYNGASWARAKRTISAGIDAAMNGQYVLVSNGVYHPATAITVSKPVHILGINGPEATSVDGSGSHRCFKLGTNACIVSGLTITNGVTYNADSDGAGIYCENETPIVTNCVFTGNSANAYGGGMFSGTANNCIFRKNYAYHGGGMRYGTANHCLFVENRAGYFAGGKYRGTANGCIFLNNYAGARGGGMIGGVAENCTVVGNTASYSGGGLHVGSAYNCIVWGNQAPEGNDLDRVSVSHCCSPDAPNGERGCIVADPLFVDAENGDYHLQTNSPCINWGRNALVSSASDLDGNPRVVEGIVDIGCYEYQSLLGLTDSDGDGLLDDWERGYFSGNVLPEANPDGDASPNGDEFIAGTDPTNGNSFFAVANSFAEMGGTNYFVVEWISIPDRFYSIQWSTNLVSGFQTLEENISFPQDSWTDTVHCLESDGFYQVDVRKE